MEAALLITPLQLDQLAADNRTCSICFEPYIENPSPSCARDRDAGHWAVRIDMVAEPSSLRRGCRHIISNQRLGACNLRDHGGVAAPSAAMCGSTRPFTRIERVNNPVKRRQPQATEERPAPRDPRFKQRGTVSETGQEAHCVTVTNSERRTETIVQASCSKCARPCKSQTK